MFAASFTSMLKPTLAASPIASVRVGDEEQNGKVIQVKNQDKYEKKLV